MNKTGIAHKKPTEAYLHALCSSAGRMPTLRHPTSHKLGRPGISESLSGVEPSAQQESPFWMLLEERNRLILSVSNSTRGLMVGSHPSVFCSVVVKYRNI